MSCRIDARAEDKTNDANASASGSCGGTLVDSHQLYRASYLFFPRGAAKGELYPYIPLNDTNTDRILEVPNSHKNPDFGFSVGRGAFKFSKGAWTTVAERVKLNTVGQADGSSLSSVTCNIRLLTCCVSYRRSRALD